MGNNNQRTSLDHQEEYFPINPATNQHVYTLNTESDPESILYRYGIFGDLRFIDKCENLSSREAYDNLIKRLYWKCNEIQTWIGEYDDETDAGHYKRIACIEQFINKIESIKNNL